MIRQIKKNLSVKRKEEILEQIIIKSWLNDYTITVDYIGILSDKYPFTADVYIHRIFDHRRNRYIPDVFVVRIEPREHRNIFATCIESLYQFVSGLVEKYHMYGNLRINGKKIEY